MQGEVMKSVLIIIFLSVCCTNAYAWSFFGPKVCNLEMHETASQKEIQHENQTHKPLF
jgi:hypothetical protein